MEVVLAFVLRDSLKLVLCVEKSLYVIKHQCRPLRSSSALSIDLVKMNLK